MNEKFTVKKVAIIIIVLYSIISVTIQQIKINNIKTQISQQEDTLQKLRDQNADLNAQVDASKTDDYIVKIIRERLGYVKKGEVPVLPQNNQQ